MKYFLIIIIVGALILSGCAANRQTRQNMAQSNRNYGQDCKLADTNLVDKGDNYIILRDNSYNYCYHIVDDNGKIIKEEIVNSPVRISIEGKEVLDIQKSFGTGLVEHVYFRVADRKFSKPFLYVVTNTEQLLAHIEVPKENTFDGRVLVVQDIFDSTKYIKQLSLDFAKVDTPVLDASFNDAQTQLTITFLSGSDQKVVTQIIDL